MHDDRYMFPAPNMILTVEYDVVLYWEYIVQLVINPCRRRILTYKDSSRTETIQIFLIPYRPLK